MAQLSTLNRHICSKFRAAQSTGAVLPTFISDRRGASTATASAATSAEEEVAYERKKLTLYRHLSRPGNWNESAVKVIKDWSREGKKLTKTNLEKAVEKLRKYGRYKHALEVSLIYLLKIIIFYYKIVIFIGVIDHMAQSIENVMKTETHPDVGRGLHCTTRTSSFSRCRLQHLFYQIHPGLLPSPSFFGTWDLCGADPSENVTVVDGLVIHPHCQWTKAPFTIWKYHYTRSVCLF